MHANQVIADLAEHQHGVMSVDQLLVAGISRGKIRSRIGTGQLVRLHGGVLRIGGGVVTWEQQLLAACLGVGPDAAASHRAAARLHGLDLRIETPVELTVPRPRTPEPPGAVLHRSVDLVPDHVVVVRGIPTTHELRLLVDLGGVVPRWTVKRALEDLVAARRVTPAQVKAFRRSVAKRGRNGCGILREILDDRALGDQISDSGLEEVCASLFRDADLPAPSFQYTIWLDGRWRRIDFCYPQLMIAIEVDGFEAHTTHQAFEDDRVRGNELELHGWLVLHFTRRQILDQPTYVASTVRRALGDRATPHISRIGGENGGWWPDPPPIWEMRG